MTHGFVNRILRIDLTTGEHSVEQPGQAFFRTYYGGGALGCHYLLKETAADTDPLGPDNLLVLAPGVTTGAKVSGASRCTATALSPLTGMVGDSQAGGSLGPAIKRAGYDAIVIRGCAEKLVYLYVDDSAVEIRDAAALAGKPVLEVHQALSAELGDDGLSIVQCGPAGERKVRFASLHADLNDVFGRTGMGAAMGGKNLRAVAVRGTGEVPLADVEGLKVLSKKAAQRLPECGFPATLRAHGTPGVVAPQAEAGNLCTRNYTRSFHERYKELDGATYDPELGAGSRTCFGCVISCRKRVKVEGPYPVSDELGGPEFETLGLLGSNLEIFDPRAVAYANQLCNQYGLDTITTGGLAAYLFEGLERGLIPRSAAEGQDLGFGKPEGLFWLIARIGERAGIGDLLAEGFEAAIAEFGEETRAFAVQTKNQGYAIHMPQVKPSLAVIYAANPFGPDHQSSEHDWLLASDGEEHWGLALLAPGEQDSDGRNKVRMAAFSQMYYSLLDTLCLCQFPWGAGSLYSYQDLEELVRCCTGWQATFFELMRAGERRINMMRQLNARRGYTRDHDRLAERVFEPLPDGPKQGAHVSRERFPAMLDEYYAIMGWDPATGNPRRGKLLELGLEWTAEGWEDSSR